MVQAKQSLGGLPDMMDRSAHAFNNISTRISHIKKTSEGFWVGFAEGMTPVADGITKLLDGLDLSGWGSRIGSFFGTVGEMIRDVGWGEMISLTWQVGWLEAINYSMTGIMKFAAWMRVALSGPIEYIDAAFRKVFDEITYWIAKIPVLNEKLGLVGFERTGFDEFLKQAQDATEEASNMVSEKITLFDESGAKAQLAEIFNRALPVYEEKIRNIQETANSAVKNIMEDVDETPFVEKLKGATLNIASDSLSKIGGFVGGFNPMGGLLAVQQDALSVQRGMLGELKSLSSKRGAVFA